MGEAGGGGRWERWVGVLFVIRGFERAVWI